MNKALIGLVVGVIWVIIAYTLGVSWVGLVPGAILVIISLIALGTWNSGGDRSGLGKWGDGSGSGS